MYRIFVDGSFGAGISSWGVVRVNERGRSRVRAGVARGGSSMAAELLAIYHGLQWNHPVRVMLFTDCLNAVSEIGRLTERGGISKNRLINTIVELARESKSAVVWKRRNSCKHSLKAHNKASEARRLP